MCAETLIGEGKPATPQVICVDQVSILHDITRKAIAQPTVFRDAVSKLKPLW